MTSIRSFLLLLAALLATSSSALACSYAYQYSLFPLGTRKGGQWIAIHLEMERNVITPDQGMGGGVTGKFRMNDDFQPRADMTVRWRGSLQLVALDLNTLQLLPIATIAHTIDIDDKTYAQELAPYFEQAAARAREEADFEPAQIERVGYCRHDNDCPYLQKEIDTTTVALRWVIEQQKEYALKAETQFPPVVLQKFENMTKLDFSDLEKVAASSRIEYFKAWKPYSVRIYRTATQQLALFTIGWGQKRFYTSTKAPTWEVPNVGGVEQYIEGNDILFHGQRFDFFAPL